MLNRLELQIEVPALTSEELLRAANGGASALVRERVLAALDRQQHRGALNARLPNAALRECTPLDAPTPQHVADAVNGRGISARAVHRALRVARTIADFAPEERVSAMRPARRRHFRTIPHRFR